MSDKANREYMLDVLDNEIKSKKIELVKHGNEINEEDINEYNDKLKYDYSIVCEKIKTEKKNQYEALTNLLNYVEEIKKENKDDEYIIFQSKQDSKIINDEIDKINKELNML